MFISSVELFSGSVASLRMFVILNSGLEVRWSKATGASDRKDHRPILIEVNSQLQESHLLPHKQPDVGPKPPDQTSLFI